MIEGLAYIVKNGDIVSMKLDNHFIKLSENGYFGGKSGEGTYHTIINQFPKHTTYVAGFMGFDAFMRIKKPAKFNIGIETNPDVVETWRNAEFTTPQLQPSKLTVIEDSFFKVDLPCFYSKDTLLYLDPPYLHRTRLSNHRYPYELTEAQHIELLQRAKELPCMVAISCYDDVMYQTELEGWRKIQFEAITRSGNMATETLYMNYPEVLPHQLHDTRFVGENADSRWNARKRMNTLFKKIDSFTDFEKARLFDEMRERYPWAFDSRVSEVPPILEVSS